LQKQKKTKAMLCGHMAFVYVRRHFYGVSERAERSTRRQVEALVALSADVGGVLFPSQLVDALSDLQITLHARPLLKLGKKAIGDIGLAKMYAHHSSGGISSNLIESRLNETAQYESHRLKHMASPPISTEEIANCLSNPDSPLVLLLIDARFWQKPPGSEGYQGHFIVIRSFADRHFCIYDPRYHRHILLTFNQLDNIRRRSANTCSAATLVLSKPMLHTNKRSPNHITTTIVSCPRNIRPRLV
jgi:hypothetical protein